MARAVVFVAFCLPAPMVCAQPSAPEPKDPMVWFVRASEQMSLRTPDSAPFHMKVTFHALPGIELTKKPQIITGDGVYEETWLALHRWRREVTLGSYHAIEVESDTQRKMQASSDYEPSRVLMLLEALLNPIPRNYLSPELNQVPLSWKVEAHPNEKIPYVRISRTIKGSRSSFVCEYIFLSNGLLVESNEGGLTTGWQDEVAFGDKAVPRQFFVRGGGQNLLAADVIIDSPGQIDPAIFDLPGGPADPGMTLRPLHYFETNRLALGFDYSYIGNSPSASAIRQVIDRHGVPRETELITTQNIRDAEPLMEGLRRATGHPAEIDKRPCEVVIYGYY